MLIQIFKADEHLALVIKSANYNIYEFISI